MGVKVKTRCIVWARAAGRCQFPGCNTSLIGDLIAGNDTLNAGYIAHIVADSADGPRGDPVRSPLLADDPANLMLMCDAHHRLIDRDEIDSYPEERLLAIKALHEARIDLASDMAPDRASHILRFAATIGVNEAAISLPACRSAMQATHYPVSRTPIDLSMTGLTLPDNHPDFFRLQAENLRRQFDAKVHGRLESQEIAHLSVFALAPMPLLIELGRLLSDITPTSVYQLHREPKGWTWANDAAPLDFVETRSDRLTDSVALKLPISASISDERIYEVLGDDTAVWSLGVANPHNDCVRQPADISAFRHRLRRLFNDIKHQHGEHCNIKLFPAVPVSVAVEIGRVWMPKADLPLQIYDQFKQEGFLFRHQLR